MRSCARGSGFALPSAIFLLVILAALGAFILTVSTSQHMGAALDVQGARAYQAARAGIEWGLYQSLQASACSPTSPSLTFSGTTLAGFTVTVSCSSSSTTELATTVTIDQITATACNQAPCPNPNPGANYVERQLTATVSR